MKPMILRRVSEEYLEVELEDQGERYIVSFWDPTPAAGSPDPSLWEEEVYRLVKGQREYIPTDPGGVYTDPDALRVTQLAWGAIPEREDYPAIGKSSHGKLDLASGVFHWSSQSPRSGAASSMPTHPGGLLEKVNRDRASRGQRPLAVGEWSTADLEEFGRHLRRRNPGQDRLKRRLMR